MCNLNINFNQDRNNDNAFNRKQNYIPTEEDRENDRLQEEWQERRRAECRATWNRQYGPSGFNANFN